MKERPKSVAIISWILIVMSVLSLAAFTLSLISSSAKEIMASNSMPIPMQYVMWYVGAMIALISAGAMLMRQNWGRFLYVSYSGLAYMVVFASSANNAVSIPGFVIYLTLAYFLFRPAANEYFKQKIVAEDD